MELSEFVSRVSGFDDLLPREKIVLFAWFMHTHRGAEIFGNAAIRECFEKLDLIAPDTSVYLPRMTKKTDRSIPELIRYKGGYKLEGGLRRALNAQYGEHPSSAHITKILADLPTKLPNLAERDFLVETLNCYRVKAFRAAVVMAWNLAYDHFVRWVLADATRTQAFVEALGKRYPKKAGFIIQKRGDFEELKESEVIEILSTANLASKNIVHILQDKLRRRNMAAHPSQVVITQPQADDTITDLVNNVMCGLT